MKEVINDKKVAILQATLELISEFGFHGTPMSQIALKANIGVGTIYRYFPSKEDLINSLYIELKSRMARCVFKNYVEDRTVKESFIMLLRALIDYLIQHPMEFHFIEQYSSSPLITASTRQEGLHIFDQATKLFIHAKESGLLKDLPLTMINALAYGATFSLVGMYLFSDDEMGSETLDKGVEAVWDALKR